MENGKQWFHSDTQGLHLLFEPFLVNGDNGLLPGYIFIAILCASERGITYYIDLKKPVHSTVTTSERIFNIISQTILYGIVTTLRLLYMLVVMYFNTGLFILVVSSLTLSQFFIEIIKSSSNSRCNKTGPLISKFQNNKGYSDLSTVNDLPICMEEDDDDEEDEYNSSSHEPHKRHYNIPKIIISNEKCCATVDEEERGRT